jgi:hypothetical protein
VGGRDIRARLRPLEFIIGPAEGRTRWRAMPGHDALGDFT